MWWQMVSFLQRPQCTLAETYKEECSLRAGRQRRASVGKASWRAYLLEYYLQGYYCSVLE